MRHPLCDVCYSYGPIAFFILVCLLRTWDSWYSIQCSCTTNPCSLLGRVIYEQRLSFVQAMGLFASQVMGMLVSGEVGIGILSQYD